MAGENGIIFVLIAVAIVGILLVLLLTYFKKGTPQLDVNKYRMRWLAIEKKLTADDAASHQLCVLNADKLLDQALKERGLKGETMGERMKSAQQLWHNADATWGAHKLRNRIAHESDVQVTYADARRALASFKQSLKDVGAI